ncbi:MAG: hypothetical protein LIP12_01220 [Clostridiales bacterium]|nr:hypothetical protein [Clostridiales bacterium]
MEQNNTEYRAAIYLRFSKEEDAVLDNEQKNSGIINQRELIRDLLKAKSNVRVVPVRADPENLRVSFECPELQIFQRQSARLWNNQ